MDDRNLVKRDVELNRSLSLTSFKDIIILSLLFSRDLFDLAYNIAEGYKSKPIETPFSDFASYLHKLKGRRHSRITSFRRLRKEKVIEIKDSKVSFDLSSDYYQKLISLKFRFFVAPKKWDGNWTLVLFDIPEQHRSYRDYLRKFLKKLGFVQWQRSVWVTINDVSDWLNKVFKNWDLGLKLWSLKAKSLSAANDKEAIRELFLNDNLEGEYEVFIKKGRSAIKNENTSQLKQLLKRLPELILKDRGIPAEFFNNSDIRRELWQMSRRMKDKLMVGDGV